MVPSSSADQQRRRRCCFIGLRPEELTRPADDIKIDLENEILRAVREGYTVFITGMDRGTDIWAGNIVARLKGSDPDLKLIAALPAPDFAARWEEAWRLKYENLLARADHTRAVPPGCGPDVRRCRDEWMIDRSALVIAVVGAGAGEAEKAAACAKARGAEIRLIGG